MKLKNSYSKFIRMEKRLNLFSFESDGMYIWERIRFRVFREVAIKLLSSPTRRLYFFKANIVDKLKLSLLMLKNSVFHNPFFAKEVDFLFLGHPCRRKMDDGYYWDIYTDPVIEQFRGKYKTATIEGYRFMKYPGPPKTRRIYYDGIIKLAAIVRKCFIKYKPTAEIDKFIMLLEKGIEDDSNVRMRLRELVYNVLEERYFEVPVIKALLKKINPRIVFVLISYASENIIEAAKQLKIPVVELQHGIITKYHLGYSYDKNSPKRNFPDYLFTFGNFWGESTEFPIPKDRIIPVGFPFLEEYKKKRKFNIAKQNQMIFVPGAMTDMISKFAIHTARLLDGRVKIIFKLHPKENKLQWRDKYPLLHQASRENLITVISGDKPAIYDLFVQAKWVVGVGSTAIYESIVFDCVPFIINIGAADYMKPLFANGAAKLVNTPEEIDLDFRPAKISKDYFFADNWKVNFENAVEHVLRDKHEISTI